MNVIFQLDVGSCKSFISNENAHITNNDSNNNKVGDELGNSKFCFVKIVWYKNSQSTEVCGYNFLHGNIIQLVNCRKVNDTSFVTNHYGHVPRFLRPQLLVVIGIWIVYYLRYYQKPHFFGLDIIWTNEYLITLMFVQVVNKLRFDECWTFDSKARVGLIRIINRAVF